MCVHTPTHTITHTLRTAASVEREGGRQRGDSIQAKVTLLNLSAALKCVHGWEIRLAPEATACPISVVSSWHENMISQPLDEIFCDQCLETTHCN